jgi:hypothetical protein
MLYDILPMPSLTQLSFDASLASADTTRQSALPLPIKPQGKLSSLPLARANMLPARVPCVRAAEMGLPANSRADLFEPIPQSAVGAVSLESSQLARWPPSLMS